MGPIHIWYGSGDRLPRLDVIRIRARPKRAVDGDLQMFGVVRLFRVQDLAQEKKLDCRRTRLEAVSPGVEMLSASR